MKTRNKGFTLIELLAVIVILAVIALIAVPQVLKILKQSRISAAEDSAYGIVKATETYYANYLLENSGLAPASELKFTCNGVVCKINDEEVLDFKGKVPTDGTITISKDGSTITVEGLVINGFKCKYENDKASCDDNGSTSGDNGSTPPAKKYTIVNDAYSIDVADIGDEIQVNGENFYVISNKDGKINALAKMNLDTIIGKQSESANTVAFSDNNGWAYENNDDIDIQSYDGPVKKAINEYKKVVTNASDVRLITKSEIETLINDGATLSGGSIKDKADAKGYEWLYSTTYWFGNAGSFDADFVWGVYSYPRYDLGMGIFRNDVYFGVRPVITLDA